MRVIHGLPQLSVWRLVGGGSGEMVHELMVECTGLREREERGGGEIDV